MSSETIWASADIVPRPMFFPTVPMCSITSPITLLKWFPCLLPWFADSKRRNFSSLDIQLSYVSYHSCWFWNILSSYCANHSTLLPLKTASPWFTAAKKPPEIDAEAPAALHPSGFWNPGAMLWGQILPLDPQGRRRQGRRFSPTLPGLAGKKKALFFTTVLRRRKTWKLHMILLWERVIWCDMWILDRFQPDRWQAMPTYARGYSNYVCCINIGQASQSIWASFALKTTHTHKKKKQPPVDFESESILVLEKHQLAIHFQTPRQPLHRPASTASAMSVARARRDTLRNSANALHDLELVTSYDQLTSHALVIPWHPHPAIGPIINIVKNHTLFITFYNLYMFCIQASPVMVGLNGIGWISYHPWSPLSLFLSIGHVSEISTKADSVISN